MQSHEILAQNKSLHLKNLVSDDLCKFLTHVLVRKSFESNLIDDEQVPDCLAIMGHELVFDTLLERLWPVVEQATNKTLLPTYTYARLYKNGNVLERHTDRDECEVSVTIQLGRSHHYAWPIYMGGKRFDLAEGDGVIYPGCEIEHWRDKCDGPPGYYSGQVFLHFVDANGPFANKVGDATKRPVFSDMFVKHRAFNMEQK
jgi:hypothetical protein